MKSAPQRALIATVLATTIVGLSATAIAQVTTPAPASLLAQHQAQRGETPPPTAKQDKAAGAREDRRAQRQDRLAQKHAERQNKLKDALKLTPAQEPAWNAFVARTGPEARPAAPATGAREDWSKLTTPQRLDKLQARQAEHAARMNQRVDAIKGFYATLTPEQQKVFDTQAGGPLHRVGLRDGHHRMGPGGHDGHPGGHRPDGKPPVQPRS